MENFPYSKIDIPQMLFHQMHLNQSYTQGLSKYVTDFFEPSWGALQSFLQVESRKLFQTDPLDTLNDYLALMNMNVRMAQRGLHSSLSSLMDFQLRQIKEAWAAVNDDLSCQQQGQAEAYWAGQRSLYEGIAYEYPARIKSIGEKFGFHFEDERYVKVCETERFCFYQVLPYHRTITPRMEGKPILIIPPYVLGANILCFLPSEDRSYVHAFANQGVPTYIRIVKDIESCPAVQTMTGEEDCLDLKHFCKQLMESHGREVTLNGYCQGGFTAAIAVLSGELDGLVDALITCVAPLDGSRSQSLVEYLSMLPKRFQDLQYAVKRLENGNEVVDGKLMSWVYKLKSIEKEAPVFAFFRDLSMLERLAQDQSPVGDTALAINHWLAFDRTDLPVSVTRLSFDSYHRPVARDGTLPVKLFGRDLNFHRIAEKRIKFLICYAEKDDLVDQPAVLAPLDHIHAEVTAFPKGHAAIATSWSHPATAYALHKTFGEKNRGPVRFQLDLEK
jgi:poly(3-hydroxyalkanoate) synthetase